MDGLLGLNKPKGPTSFDLIRQLRRITGVRKIGHTGTLDPLASGLMLMLFGAATKQAQNFSKLDKTYLAEITLGANSTTGDAEGELKPVSDRVPIRSEVDKLVKGMIGEIEQIPPIYSAIKVGGKEAYKLARQGKTVDLPARRVNVYELTIQDYSYPKLEIEAKVSSGTYIRSLAADIGQKLETGAFLSDLTRTKVGNYHLENALDLDQATPETIKKALTQDY